MANILQNAAYMALPMNIKRGNPIPLDTTAVWYSKTELENYAKTGATAYVGQILTLIADSKCEAYMISNEAGTLVKLAQTTTSGDLASDVANLQSQVNGLITKVGSAASEGVAATGLYKEIANTLAIANKGVSDAATAQSAANTAQSDVDTLEGVVGADDNSGLRKRIKANETAIGVLVGSVTGDNTKSARAIAQEEVAKIVDSAPDSFDTLKEIAAWISEHGNDALAMQNAITALQNIVDGIGGEGEKATVKAYVDDAISALSIGDYAKAADLTALAARVDTLEKNPAASITAEQIESWNNKQNAGNYVDQDAYNTKITALEAADTANTQAIAAAQATADAAVPKNAATSSGTGIKVTVDSNGLVTGLSGLSKADIPTIDQSQVDGLPTALAGKQNNLTFNTAYDAATNKAATMSDIGDAKTALVGTSEDKSTVDTIKGAKKYADEKASSALSDAKSYADGLVTGDSGITKRVETLEGKVDVDKVSTAISTAKTAAANDATSKVNAAKTAILGKNDDNSDYIGTVKGAYEAAAAAKSAADSKIDAAGVEAYDYATKAQAKGYADAKDAAITAAQNAADAVAAKVGTIEEGKTAAGLISENATAISGINTKIGTVPSGNNLVQMIADAKSEASYDDTAVRGLISDNTTAISTLNGNDTTVGSVKKTVKDAINDFATKISDDGTVNTFKELVDYVAAHGSEYTDAIADIATNKSAIETLNGNSSTVGSVDKKIADAIAGENLSQYAKNADLNAAKEDIARNTNSITELNGDTSVNGSVASKVKAAVDPVIVRVSALEGKVTDTKIAQWDAAQENIIESIKVNGTALTIGEDKSVNISVASASTFGVAKIDNTSIESNNGVLGVKAVGVSKLFVEEGTELILFGGNA